MSATMTGRAGTNPTATAPPGWSSARWTVWNGVAEIVVGGDPALARAMAQAVLDDVDEACSRFRPDSDLCRVNAAAGSWVPVRPLLADVLTAGLRAAAVTDGLVDPTLGRVLADCGYDADLAALELVTVADAPAGGPADVEAAHPHPATAWREVRVRREAATEICIPEGTALDLGAVGKAWAVDAILTRLGGAGLAAAVSIGGDVAVSPGHPWRVDVRESPGGPVQQRLTVRTGAIATSSTVHRRWRQSGRVRHHIVDPRTGGPAAEVWRTATVTAMTAVDANTAATAALVLGTQAPSWLAGHGLAARLVAADGSVTLVGGWPPAPSSGPAAGTRR